VPTGSTSAYKETAQWNDFKNIVEFAVTQQYTITASAGSNGNISPSGNITVNQGDSQTFTFTPNSGYEINQVLVDGVNNTAAVSSGSYTFMNVTTNHTISVTFKQKAVPTYIITASVGNYGGSISPSGNITVSQGGSQSFYFTPNTGYEISQVLVDGVNNTTAVSNGSYTFSNVTTNHTISVSFKQKALPNYTITASVGNYGGSISPSGNITVSQGGSQSFIFTPNVGYEIDQVLVDGVNNPTAVLYSGYTFSNVTANHSISVTFKQKVVPNYIIAASAGSNGSISPSGNVTISQGGSQIFTFTPNTGYEINQVLVDGVNNPTAVFYGGYTFSTVTANHAITVSFKQKQYTITVSVGANGSIAPPSNQTVAHGGSQTFTFAPNTGYEINQVLVDGINNPTAILSGSYTFANVSANHSISVSFKVLSCLPNLVVQIWDDVLSVINNPAHNGGYTFVAYQWQKNGVNIPGEALGNLYFTNETKDYEAQYSVLLTTANGQQLRSCPVKLRATGDSELRGYPNPTSGFITIENETIHAGDKIEIFNMQGALVRQYVAEKNQTTLNLSSFQKGTYIVKVNSKRIKVVKK
jgi:hypothetical protein